MNYDVDYFIEKFESIPEKEIGANQPKGCAYGQCAMPRCTTGGERTEEGIALTRLMMSIPNMTAADVANWGPYTSTPARINNGEVKQYQQPTPKQRILAALRDIKKMQAQESKTHVDETPKFTSLIPIVDEVSDVKIKLQTT